MTNRHILAADAARPRCAARRDQARSASAECDLTIHEAGLIPLAQNYGPLAGRPQYAAEQVLDPAGTLASATGVARTERDHNLWSSTDSMSICRGLENKQLSCNGFDLPPDLAALDGHASTKNSRSCLS